MGVVLWSEVANLNFIDWMDEWFGGLVVWWSSTCCGVAGLRRVVRLEQGNEEE